MLCPKMTTTHFVVLLLLISLCNAAFGNDSEINIREEEKTVLDQLLATGKYDPRIIPPGVNGTGGPVVVRVSAYVRRSLGLDDNKQEYSFQLTFRQKWVDERLKFDDMGGKLKYLSLTAMDRIWRPDTFFSNEIQSNFHTVPMPQTYIRIFPGGDVLYSTIMSVALDCPMDLEHYPFDRHECELRMSSYGHFTNNLFYLWREADPLDVSKTKKLQGFSMVKYSADFCSTRTIAPEYSCLKAVFTFERHLMPTLIRIYIPSCVLVLASFVSFWLNPSSVAARVLLGASTLLAMVFQMTISAATSPAASYIKAVDIWLGVCLLFVFGTLLEFATLNYLSSFEAKSKAAQTEDITLLVNDESEKKKSWTSRCKQFPTWMSTFARSKKIDVVSRIMFPMSFAVFNLAYWIAYLTPRDS